MKNQKGFAVLEGLLILVIIAMLAGTSWYVMKAQKNTNDTLSKTANQTAQKSSSVKPLGKTLTIKELGIEMQLPDNLQGVQYKATDITSVDGQKTTAIYFSDSDYANDIAKCYGQSPEPLSFGAMTKAKGQYPKDANIDNTDGALLKQFENFYISWSVPNGITTCSEDTVDPGLVQYDARKLQDLFTEAFKKTATITQ